MTSLRMQGLASTKPKQAFQGTLEIQGAGMLFFFFFNCLLLFYLSLQQESVWDLLFSKQISIQNKPYTILK